MKATSHTTGYIRIILFIGILSILVNAQPSFLANVSNAYAQEDESSTEEDNQIDNSNSNEKGVEQEEKEEDEDGEKQDDVQGQNKNDDDDDDVGQEEKKLFTLECNDDEQSFSEKSGKCVTDEDNSDSFLELEDEEQVAICPDEFGACVIDEDNSRSLDLNVEGVVAGAGAKADFSSENGLESTLSFPEGNLNIAIDPSKDEEQTENSVQDKGKAETETPPSLFIMCDNDVSYNRESGGPSGCSGSGWRGGATGPNFGNRGPDSLFGEGGIGNDDNRKNKVCSNPMYRDLPLCKPNTTPKTGEYNSGDGSGVICPSDMKETESPESLHCKLQNEKSGDGSNGDFASKLVDAVRNCRADPKGPFCLLANNGDGGADPGNGGADPGNGGADPGNGGADPGNGGADPGNGGADPGNGGAQIDKESFSRTTISNHYQTVNNNSPPAGNMMPIHRTQVNSVQCPITNAETKTLRYDQLSFSDKGFMPIVEVSPHHIVCGHILIIGPGSIRDDLKIIAIQSSSADSQTSIQHAINMNPTKNTDPKTGKVNYIVDLKPVITGINPFTGMTDAMFHATGILLFNGNNNNSINNSGYDSENSFKDTRLLTKIVFQ